MDVNEREEFLAVYEPPRVDGDLEALTCFLAEDLVLEDPQLPFGIGDRELLLQLTREFTAGIQELSLSGHRPVCVSADGSCFTQRWFTDGALAEDPTARVSFETVEMYHAPSSEVERIAIFARGMAQPRCGLPQEFRRPD